MRIRDRLFFLTASTLVLPAILAGLFLSATRLDSLTRMDLGAILRAREWFSGLDRATATLEGFLREAEGGEPYFEARIEGEDGELLASIPKVGRHPRENDGELTNWHRDYSIRDYGLVRAVAMVGMVRTSRGFDPPVLIGLFVFLILMAGNAVIARNLSLSFKSLDAAAKRLRSGDLDTPVDYPRDRDSADLALSLESLRMALVAERAARARLIMAVSHDFRTPLALIRGYAESIESGVARDESRRNTYLRIIRDKTVELDGLVEELLDFARTETDQRRSAPVIGDVRAFLAGLAAEFEEDAILGGRRFSLKDRVGEPAHGLLDARLARRAFENLFSNAMRYTEPGGLIELELEMVEGDRLVMSLSDDGIGIPPGDMRAIFEPFNRGSNVGGRGGHGLGLSIVKSVLDGLGWSIQCGPRPGGGTRFSVVAPLAPRARA